MKREEFNEFVERVLQDVRARLVEKEKEYARGDDDRLRQFKLMAHGIGLAPEAVCLILADKHWSALKDAFIPKSKLDNPIDELDFVFEKTLDVICYMILLYALVEEKRIGDYEQRRINTQEVLEMLEKKALQNGESVVTIKVDDIKSTRRCNDGMVSD